MVDGRIQPKPTNDTPEDRAIPKHVTVSVSEKVHGQTYRHTGIHIACVSKYVSRRQHHREVLTYLPTYLARGISGTL